MSELSGPQIGQLVAAMQTSFVQNELDRFLLYRLDRHIDQIMAANATLTDAADAVARTANREGWIGDLMRAIRAEREDRPDLLALCAELLDSLGEPVEPGRPVLPPPEIPAHLRRAQDVFIGREKELRALEAALLAPEAGGRAVAIGAVQGMPGVGKSYLAARFLSLHADRYPETARVAFGIEDKRDADAVCRDLLDALKVQAGPDGPYAALRGRLLANRALLLVENADDEDRAGVAATLVGGLGGVPAIVTGRYRNVGRGVKGWARVEVQPFTEKEALEQLEAEHRAPLNGKEAKAFRDLAGALGHLPLAVHLAAGYLAIPGETVEGFLGHLRARGLKIGPRDAADPLKGEGARAILAETFELSLAALGRALAEVTPDPAAALAGFRALSHAPLIGFGRSLGAAIAGLDGDAFGRLVVAAVSLSMLECEGATGQERFRVHPLLAELLRTNSDAIEAEGRMAAWFLERLPERDDPQGWHDLNAEYANLRDWLDHVSGEAARRIEQAGSRYAKSNGPYRAWMALCERGLAATEDCEERSSLLWTMCNVARFAGKMDLAQEKAQEKLALDRERGDEAGVAGATDVIADILQSRGQLDEALRLRREEVLPALERAGDERNAVVIHGKIADILQARGDLDEALHIWRDVQLPSVERLRDVRSAAVTQGKIADILQARGELDEALRIRWAVELPVYERLGDVREQAIAQGKIADILAGRGEFDEALRIRMEVELPVYERLGDMREWAVTQGKIADILLERGELDKALHIWQEVQLPTFQRLRDVRLIAMTQGKIATTLARRGELDQALCILQQEVLPTFHELGDVRSVAVTEGRIANILQAHGELDEALSILQEITLPVYERLGDVRERAVTQGKIGEILYLRGELGEAVRILREEVLPIYEQMGEVRSLVVGRANLAVFLLQRNAAGDREEAVGLLRLVLEDARRLRIPEAGQIEQILARVGCS
jgi:tetratricopeptide (TPR) repeat protein